MIEVNGLLNHVADLADRFHLVSLQPQIAACRQQLGAPERIDVAVFGRFKAGKSSFLNHLAGRAVLPIGVLPLTAIVTRLRHGPIERAVVRFLDGTTKSIPLDDIGLYAGENQNPRNARQVAEVEVELPSLQSFAPLEFVDTPGLGSAFTHNTRAALNWLPNVGAALVAVSADAPLSERDLNLLDELRHHTPRIALLLTKADLLTESQRTEVRDFLRRQLAEHWGEGGLPVFFYSIKPEFQELKTALVEGLLQPLRQDRGLAAEQILRHKLISLIGQALDYLRVALAAATQAQASRQALHDRLLEERGQFDALREELHLLAHDVAGQALEQSVQRLEPIQRTLQAKVTADLEPQLRQWRLRLPPLLEAWRAWLNDFLTRELTEVSHAQRGMFCQPLQKARERLTRALRAFQDRLAEHVKAALGVTLTRREFALQVREPSAPPVHVSYGFDAAFTTMGWLLPLTLFGQPIRRVLLRKARWEVEKNLSRLAADWQTRASAGVQELRLHAEQYALNELGTLEQMLAQGHSSQPQVETAMALLTEALAKIHGPPQIDQTPPKKSCLKS
jgi:GTP-binding protein EngB required for normal cell division